MVRLTRVVPFSGEEPMAQQPTNTFRIPSPDDARLLQMLEAMALALNTSFSLAVGNLSMGSVASVSEAKARLNFDLAGSRIISSSHISSDRFSINFQRAVTSFGIPNLVEPSIWEAEFFAEKQSHDAPDASSKMLMMLEVIESYRREVSAKIKPAQAPKDFTDIYARQLADLTELHNKIVRDAEEARLRTEDELAQRRAKQAVEAEEERAKIAAEAEAARQKIAEEDEALAIRKKDIDDRSHTHARRQMREAITSELKARQQRPSASNGTALLRIIIVIVCVAISALLGALALTSSREIFVFIASGKPLGAAFYAIVGRGALLTLGTVGVGGYLLNFLRKLHDEDLRAERDLERYLYDVDRASWAIETVLEAQRRDGEEEPIEIPQEWVQGVTRGLFQRAESRDPEEASLAAMGSIFNFAAEAELGPGGTKIKFNKPGIRALRRHAENTDG